jgi:hypothetical protein
VRTKPGSQIVSQADVNLIRKGDALEQVAHFIGALPSLRRGRQEVGLPTVAPGGLPRPPSPRLRRATFALLRERRVVPVEGVEFS